MKLKRLKRGYSINELSTEEVSLIFEIIETLDDRCFEKFDDFWSSKEDFLYTINDEERQVLQKLADTIRRGKYF
jgi:hypothetical protein